MSIEKEQMEFCPDKDDEGLLKNVLEGGIIRDVECDEMLGTITLRVSADGHFFKVTFGSRMDESRCYINRLM